MPYDYYSNLNLEFKLRYEKKLELIKMTDCPYRLPADLWKNDPTRWPVVEYGDIYDYLINTPGN